MVTLLNLNSLHFRTGELHFEDNENPEKPTILTPGDVLLVEAGTIVRVTSPSVAKGMSEIGICFSLVTYLIM